MRNNSMFESLDISILNTNTYTHALAHIESVQNYYKKMECARFFAKKTSKLV